MVKQVAENPVNPTTLPNPNPVIKTYFAPNNADVTVDYSIADSMMRTLGYVYRKIRNVDMIG